MVTVSKSWIIPEGMMFTAVGYSSAQFCWPACRLPHLLPTHH